MTLAPTTALLDAVPDPMLLLTEDGIVAHANPAAVGFLGGWIIGRNYGSVLRQPALLAQIEAVQGGDARAVIQIERSEQAGVAQYRVHITRLADPDGALVLHFTDVTHLSEAEEMRRDFVANVSHELRTPLTSVLGFIETLRGPAREDAAAQDRFLGIMEDEARRMNRLISDLLSLSRVEAAERLRPNETIDVVALLDSVMAALGPRAREAGNTLRLLKPETPVHVQGDRDQLTQVFTNLTDNALKYGGPDRPVTLAVTQGTGRAGVVVSVTDEGPGIASQHLPRLTERFYRVDAHRSRDMGGTGLGLAIVKHIVNRHRGRLKITSEQGNGSTFAVQFPAD